MDKKHITIESPSAERFTGRTDDGKTVLDLEFSAEAFGGALLPMAKLVKNLGFESMTYSWRSIPSPVPHEKGPMSIDEFIDWCVPAVLKHKTVALISIDSLKLTPFAAEELEIKFGQFERPEAGAIIIPIANVIENLQAISEDSVVDNEDNDSIKKALEQLATMTRSSMAVYVSF